MSLFSEHDCNYQIVFFFFFFFYLQTTKRPNIFENYEKIADWQEFYEKTGHWQENYQWHEDCEKIADLKETDNR